LTNAITIPAHAAPPAPTNASREIPDKSNEAAAFALHMVALARGQPQGAVHGDAGAISGGAQRSAGKNGRDAKSPPVDMASQELIGAALAFALTPAPRASSQGDGQAQSSPAHAELRTAHPLGSRLSQAAAEALSLAPASAPLADRAIAANVDQPSDQAPPPAVSDPFSTPTEIPTTSGPTAVAALVVRVFQTRTFLALDHTSGIGAMAIVGPLSKLDRFSAASNAPPLDQIATSTPGLLSPPAQTQTLSSIDPHEMGSASSIAPPRPPQTPGAFLSAVNDCRSAGAPARPTALDPPAPGPVNINPTASFEPGTKAQTPARQYIDPEQMSHSSSNASAQTLSASASVPSASLTQFISSGERPANGNATAHFEPPKGPQTQSPPNDDSKPTFGASSITPPSEVEAPGSMLSAGSNNPLVGQTAPSTTPDLSAASTNIFASPSVVAAPAPARQPSEFNRESDARSVRGRDAAGLDHAGTNDASIAPTRQTQAPVAPLSLQRDAGSPASDAPLRGVVREQKKSSPPEAPADTPAIAPAPAAANIVGSFNIAANPIGRLKADQLPQFIAAQADGLRQENTTAAATPFAPGLHVVKELDIELAPEGLGVVSLKMRVTNGKLAIIMEVSSANALKTVRAEHAAISNSLGSGGQPLESLVIRQSEPSQSQGEKHDASNSGRGTRRDERGDSGSASPHGQSAGQRQPRTAPTPIAPRRRADGLLV
jgi:chemotaxis protein MotD